MTDSRLDSFQDHFDEVLRESQKFAFLTRSIRLQTEAADKLKDLANEIKSYKDEMIKEQNEFAANTLLSLEAMAYAQRKEIEMLKLLKENKSDQAWDCLIDSQMGIRAAMQANPTGASHLEGYINKLTAYERLIFPNQMFMSTGLIAKESKCSICDLIYGECEHLIGKAYMGQICHEIVTQADLQEVSIVENPASKKCRTITFQVDGTNRNWMTLDPVEKDSIK